jgi:hypothetical protein
MMCRARIYTYATATLPKKKHTRRAGEVSEPRADVSFIEGKTVNYSRADEQCLLYLEGH